MKDLLYLTSSFCLALILNSCGSEDGCTSESVAGTYTFESVECNDEDLNRFIEGVFAESDWFSVRELDKNSIAIENAPLRSLTGSFFEFSLTDCSFEFTPKKSSSEIVKTREWNGEFTDNELIIRFDSEVIFRHACLESSDHINTICTYIATR